MAIHTYTYTYTHTRTHEKGRIKNSDNKPEVSMKEVFHTGKRVNKSTEGQASFLEESPETAPESTLGSE